MGSESEGIKDGASTSAVLNPPAIFDRPLQMNMPSQSATAASRLPLSHAKLSENARHDHESVSSDMQGEIAMGGNKNGHRSTESEQWQQMQQDSELARQWDEQGQHTSRLSNTDNDDRKSGNAGRAESVLATPATDDERWSLGNGLQAVQQRLQQVPDYGTGECTGNANDVEGSARRNYHQEPNTYLGSQMNGDEARQWGTNAASTEDTLSAGSLPSIDQSLRKPSLEASDLIRLPGQSPGLSFRRDVSVKPAHELVSTPAEAGEELPGSATLRDDLASPFQYGKGSVTVQTQASRSSPPTAVGPGGSVGLSRDGSFARTNAIAKLKRAASQREIRNRSPGPGQLGTERETPTKLSSTTSPVVSQNEAVITAPVGGTSATLAASSGSGSRLAPTPLGETSFLTHDSRSTSPGQDRSVSRGVEDGGDGSAFLGSNLSRSGSRVGGNKSPLPSLEQLRARILQERLTAGLARSASTSEASAAARRYAMEKLLGTSFREGAVSPVSDTAEEQQEEEKRVSVAKMERPLLRRSRTIGGLSAMAEAQRKAAFVEALDKGVPDEVANTRRSSRRFAHGPPGRDSHKAEDTPNFPVCHQEATGKSGLNLLQRRVAQAGASDDKTSASERAQQPSSDTPLDRNASQRQVIRTEMMRKLSSRRGARSPANALEESQRRQPQAQQVSSNPSGDRHDGNGGSVNTSQEVESERQRRPSDTALHAPGASRSEAGFITPQHLPRLAMSPNTGLLQVPTHSALLLTPSSRSSVGFQHDIERNRASEMARLHDEEAFEFERLLELGYTTDDALDRVASARSGSFNEGSSLSPRAALNELRSHEDAQGHRPASSSLSRGALPASDGRVSAQDFSLLHNVGTAAAPNTLQHRSGGHGANQRDEVSMHPSEASIPVGLASSARLMDSGRGSVIDEERMASPLSSQQHTHTSPFPESVIASTTSLSSYAKRDSEGAPTQPGNAIASTLSVPLLGGSRQNITAEGKQRLEDYLSPSFLAEVGNPLDFAHSPGRPTTSRDGADGYKSVLGAEDDDEGLGSLGGHSDLDAEDTSEDYLEKVGRMADRLGRFTRKTRRSARDLAVLNSSAAQVEAAAKDLTRNLAPSLSSGRLELSSASASPELGMSQASTPHTATQSPSAGTVTALPLSQTPNELNRSSPSLPPLAPPVGQHGRQMSKDLSHLHFPGGVGAPNAQLYAANQKLAPFPILFANKQEEARAAANPQSIPAHASDSLQATESRATDHPLPEHSDAVVSRSASSNKETFMSSLRRKASGRAVRNTGTVDSPALDAARPMSPTKRLHSLLSRRPSGKKNAPLSTLTHHRQNSASRSRTNAPHIGEIFHISSPIPDTPTLPDTERTAHSRNASISSTATARPADEAITILDAGGANEPATLSPAAAGLAPATAAVLNRYSRVLTSSTQADAAEISEIPGLTMRQIEKPPRRLIMSAPVLQVVTSSTIKDRFLFLFSDLLVLAKPVQPPEGSQTAASDELPTMAWTFSVKSIIDIDNLKLTMPKAERKHSTSQTPLMTSFIRDFAHHPQNAISTVINKSNLPRTPPTIAQFLQQTPELDRQQLSNFLFNPEDGGAIMKAYIQLEKLTGVSIESALRSLLLELRFPERREAFQELLIAFARRWTDTNRALIKENFTPQLAIDLVLAIMCLNDAVHGKSGATPGYFSAPNPHMTSSAFVTSFRPLDPQCVLSDRTLMRIYGSIITDPLQQALLPVEPGPTYSVRVFAPGVPSRLTYGVSSEPVRLVIPRPDKDFAVRLYGEGMTFQPQILSFAKTSVQEFRITSKTLGVHTMVFVCAGRNARRYRSLSSDCAPGESKLPRSANVSVQRAFMENCFTLTTQSHRRFLLSVADGEQRKQWLRCIKERIEVRRGEVADSPVMTSGSAHSLSLHVLREALIQTNTPSPRLQRSVSTTRSSSAGGAGSGTPLMGVANGLSRAPSDSRALYGGFGSHPVHADSNHGYGAAHAVSSANPSSLAAVQRNESVSRHYYTQGRPGHTERELMEGQPDTDHRPSLPSSSALATSSPILGSANAQSKAVTGDELALIVKQNSLLALVIAHAQRRGV